MSTQKIVNAGAVRTVVERNCLLKTDDLHDAPGGAILDATYAYDGRHTGWERWIRPGTFLARIAASGLWVPCKRTTVTASGGATAADVPVVDASAFRVGDTITVGGDTGKTITAVNYGTNVITVSGSAFAFANSEPVFASGALAGAGDARRVLYDWVDLWDEPTRTYVDRASSATAIAGTFIASAMLGDLAAIVAADKAGGGYLSRIKFDTDTGNA